MRRALARLWTPAPARALAVVLLGGLALLQACGRPAPPAALQVPACQGLGPADVRVGCPCPAGLEPLGGGCVARPTAAGACGPRVDPEDTSCSPVSCPRGEALDPSRGACVAPRELAELPEISWLRVHEGEHLGCADGGTLEVAYGHAGCRPEGTCRFHTTWNGKACVKPAACPVGAYREGDTCKPLVSGRAVDLTLWLRRVLEPELCLLLPMDNAAETFRVAVDAPANELAQVSVSIEGSSRSLPTVRRAAEALTEGLRSLRVDATANHVERVVACPPRKAATPKVDVELDAGL